MQGATEAVPFVSNGVLWGKASTFVLVIQAYLVLATQAYSVRVTQAYLVLVKQAY
jgi:hypothetical protein